MQTTAIYSDESHITRSISVSNNPLTVKIPSNKIHVQESTSINAPIKSAFSLHIESATKSKWLSFASLLTHMLQYSNIHYILFIRLCAGAPLSPLSSTNWNKFKVLIKKNNNKRNRAPTITRTWPFMTTVTRRLSFRAVTKQTRYRCHTTKLFAQHFCQSGLYFHRERTTNVYSYAGSGKNPKKSRN